MIYEPLVSVIIPVLNEEKYLASLLDSLQKQTYKNLEIIVADAGSTDRTAEVAQEHGAVVVEGGKPAAGRNNGAYAANGEFLFFFDADVLLSENFIEKILTEFHEKYFELATTNFVPDSDLNLDKLIFRLANRIMEISQFVHPLAPGFSILCTRRIFYRVGGFDESLHLAEDHDFVSKGAKWARFGIIRKTPLRVSMRRFEKEGRLNLVRKYIFSELYRMYKGKIDDDTFEYTFGGYEDIGDLSELEKRLEKFLAFFDTKNNK